MSRGPWDDEDEDEDPGLPNGAFTVRTCAVELGLVVVILAWCTLVFGCASVPVRVGPPADEVGRLLAHAQFPAAAAAAPGFTAEALNTVARLTHDNKILSANQR